MVDCGGLESPDNGTVDLSGGTTFGSTAVYSCDEVFELDGNSSRVCLSSGIWSNEAPVCYSECHCSMDYVDMLVCESKSMTHVYVVSVTDLQLQTETLCVDKPAQHITTMLKVYTHALCLSSSVPHIVHTYSILLQTLSLSLIHIHYQ